MSISKNDLTIFETILARRSVRHYKSRKVDGSIINILLNAAVRAPTAIHQEPWAFVIIQDVKLLQNLSDQAKPQFVAEMQNLASENNDCSLDIFTQSHFNIFYNANTLILVCGNTKVPFSSADCWLASENFMLAACGMGLGTCVIGSALPFLNLPETKLKLQIPENYSVISAIVLGYPDEDITPKIRKKPIILANIEAISS